MTEVAEKKCPECGNPIMGRADKKFCSDMCRNAYNNKQNSTTNNLVRRVNAILKKNRRTMEILSPNGKAKVKRSKLMEQGFDFSYFTNTYETKEGNIYYFCYDYGYLELKDDFFVIVRRD